MANESRIPFSGVFRDAAGNLRDLFGTLTDQSPRGLPPLHAAFYDANGELRNIAELVDLWNAGGSGGTPNALNALTDTDNNVYEVFNESDGGGIVAVGSQYECGVCINGGKCEAHPRARRAITRKFTLTRGVCPALTTQPPNRGRTTALKAECSYRRSRTG